MKTLILLLFGIGLSYYAAAKSCPSKLPKGAKTYVYQETGYCYVFSGENNKLSRDDADKECRKHGGFLTSYTTDTESKVLFNLMESPNYKGEVWIGLTDRKEENVYRWDDGYAYFLQNWADDEGPNTRIEHYLQDCVALSSVDRRWHDHRCFFSHKFPYICKIKI